MKSVHVKTVCDRPRAVALWTLLLCSQFIKTTINPTLFSDSSRRNILLLRDHGMMISFNSVIANTILSIIYFWFRVQKPQGCRSWKFSDTFFSWYMMKLLSVNSTYLRLFKINCNYVHFYALFVCCVFMVNTIYILIVFITHLLISFL